MKFSKKIVDLVKAKLKGQLISNFLTVASISIIVKGVSFFKEMAIADVYGISEVIDTYLIAALIPMFIQNVFLNSYSSVFIPNYIIEKKEKFSNLSSFQSTSFIVTIGIALIMTLIVFVGIDHYLSVLFPNHSIEYYSLIKKQFYVILPCIFLWAISSLVSGLLNIEEEYIFSTFSSIYVPLCTIIFLTFFSQIFKELTLALGLLVGSLLSCIYLIIIGFKKKIFLVSKPNLKIKNVRKMLFQLPAKISSSVIHGLNPVVDQYYSAQLAIGAIATLNYGFKIPIVLVGLLTVPLTNTLLPYFSKLAVDRPNNSFEGLYKILRKSFVYMTILTLILVAFSKIIITVVFQRGTFTSDDTEIVYVIQQLYLFQLPFYVMAIIMNRFLNAINKNNFLVFSSTLNLILNISLNYFLLNLMGIKGIALATSIVYFVNAIVIYMYIKRIAKSIA